MKKLRVILFPLIFVVLFIFAVLLVGFGALYALYETTRDFLKEKKFLKHRRKLNH